MEFEKVDIEPGNEEGLTVLRWLVEQKQVPLEIAADKCLNEVIYQGQQFKRERKLLTTSIGISAVIGLPILFPLGISTALVGSAIAAAVWQWQELSGKFDRLMPEYHALKQSPLLMPFVAALARQIKERQDPYSYSFNPRDIAPAQLLGAYEHTIELISQGQHLEMNASDPVLALYLLSLRKVAHYLPDWIVGLCRELEEAEKQRARDLASAQQRLQDRSIFGGSIYDRPPGYIPSWERAQAQNQIGQQTRLNAVDVPVVREENSARREGEQGLGKLSTNYSPKEVPRSYLSSPDPQRYANPNTSISPPSLHFPDGLPLRDRAEAILKRLSYDDFNLGQVTTNQIVAIAGNQRGGKGTLLAILATLSQAYDSNTRIHYFTAGDDVYPFQCERLICRLSYPELDPDEADGRVAQELFNYLKEMSKAPVGEYADITLVIDELMALSDYWKDEQKIWVAKFLLSRASKKGAQVFLVLHASNLTAWVGAKATNGMAQTFKTGVSFVGCESTPIKLSPFKSISVATGRYFLTSPEDFSKPIEDGEIGTIPDWLKTETNPATGQPDPARTLLTFFPELVAEYSKNDPGDTLTNVPIKTLWESESDIRRKLEWLSKQTPKDDIPVAKKLPESERGQMALDIIQQATKYPVSFEAIRTSRKWEGQRPTKADLLAALDELLGIWLTGSVEEGYYLLD